MHTNTDARLRQEGEEIEYVLLAAMGQKLRHMQQKMDNLTLPSVRVPSNKLRPNR